MRCCERRRASQAHARTAYALSHVSAAATPPSTVATWVSPEVAAESKAGVESELEPPEPVPEPEPQPAPQEEDTAVLYVLGYVRDHLAAACRFACSAGISDDELGEMFRTLLAETRAEDEAIAADDAALPPD